MTSPVGRRSWTERFSAHVGLAAAGISTALLLATVAGFAADYRKSPLELGLPAWLIGIGLLGGLAIVASSWVASRARPSPTVGLAAVAVGLMVPAWAGWTILPGPAQAGVLAIAPIAIAGASHIGLTWSRADHPSAPLIATYALGVSAVVVLAVGYNPLADPGCVVTCVNVQPAAANLISSRTAYALATAFTSAAAATAAIALMRKASRGRFGVVIWAALLAVIVLCVPWIAHAVWWTIPSSPVAAMLPGVMAGILVGVGPIVAASTSRRVRRDVRELVAHLSDPGVRGRNGRSHIRAVQFAVPGLNHWVDWSGVEVESPDDPSRMVVVTDAAGQALRFAVAAGDDPREFLATLGPATMLALQNARLAAVRQARMAEVQASQRRIVDAADAERQRIEHDLHDGAQQRLVGTLFQLSLARARLAAGGETLSRAQASVHEALERLRLLGHGIFPATLATEGPAAALEDLARASDLPTTLDVGELGPGLGRDVAMAAYAVVAAVLAHAVWPPGSVSAEVKAATRDGTTELRIRLIGSVELGQDDLVDVADRVGAVGGHLAVEPIDGGVAITAVMPCA